MTADRERQIRAEERAVVTTALAALVVHMRARAKDPAGEFAAKIAEDIYTLVRSLPSGNKETIQ